MPPSAGSLYRTFRGDILGLIDLQDEAGGMTHDPGRRLGRKKDHPGPTDPHNIAPLGLPEAPEAGIVEPGLEPVKGIKGLGPEGRTCLYPIPPKRCKAQQ